MAQTESKCVVLQRPPWIGNAAGYARSFSKSPIQTRVQYEELQQQHRIPFPPLPPALQPWKVLGPEHANTLRPWSDLDRGEHNDMHLQAEGRKENKLPPCHSTVNLFGLLYWITERQHPRVISAYPEINSEWRGCLYLDWVVFSCHALTVLDMSFICFLWHSTTHQPSHVGWMVKGKWNGNSSTVYWVSLWYVQFKHGSLFCSIKSIYSLL